MTGDIFFEYIDSMCGSCSLRCMSQTTHSKTTGPLISMVSMDYWPASHAFHAFIFVNSCAFHAFHGFIFHAFHAFMGNTFTIFLFQLAWKAWKFPHENHGILLWLHAPWISRDSMEFSPCFFHGFSMDFPCFQHQGSKEYNGCRNLVSD